MCQHVLQVECAAALQAETAIQRGCEAVYASHQVSLTAVSSVLNGCQLGIDTWSSCKFTITHSTLHHAWWCTMQSGTVLTCHSGVVLFSECAHMCPQQRCSCMNAQSTLLLQANIQELEADVRSAAASLHTLESQVRSPCQSCFWLS